MIEISLQYLHTFHILFLYFNIILLVPTVLDIFVHDIIHNKYINNTNKYTNYLMGIVQELM